MRILITNDDGINAPGIQALAEAMTDLGEIVVVAPDRNRSGASNSLTLSAPLQLRELKPNHIYVEGTPTDCVHLAMSGLLDPIPDLVVSGINDGTNLGDDVLYSGTVAAAIEGRFFGVPSIAFSLQGRPASRYTDAARIAQNIVRHIIDCTLPRDTLLNVNIPDCNYDEYRGIDITRLGTRHRSEPTIKQIDPRGRDIYWIGPPGAEQDAGPGTDFYALSEKKVTITPLHVDLTHYKMIDEIAKILED